MNDFVNLHEDFDLDRELEREKKLQEELEAEDALAQAQGEQYDEAALKWEQSNDIRPAISGIDFLNRPKRPITAYVPGYIYAGGIQAIIGPPKAGKSTFLWAMIDNLMEQRSFLGEATRLPGNVLYVTEQSEISFDSQLIRLPEGMRERILSNKKFALMLPENHKKTSVLNKLELNVPDWTGRLELWKEALDKTEADLFVLDTFNQYADLGPQGENDNALIGKRIMELRQLQDRQKRLAILLVCHSNKAGGKKRFLSLQDVRGGSALAGALDHGVTFQKPSTGGTVRLLNTESRMVEDTKNIVARLSNGSYISLIDKSIRDIQDELGVSYRQARKLFKDLNSDSDPDDDENRADQEKPLSVHYVDNK